MLTELETRRAEKTLRDLTAKIERKERVIQNQAGTIRRQGELIRKDLERRQNQESVWEVQQLRIEALERELQDERTCVIPNAGNLSLDVRLLP